MKVTGLDTMVLENIEPYMVGRYFLFIERNPAKGLTLFGQLFFQLSLSL